MALNAYLKLVGTTQGEIKGSVTQKGREGKIMVIAVSHEIGLLQAAPGQPSERRDHGPLVITKEVDKATVPLRSMLVNGEVAKDWELQFWRPSAAGAGAGTETQHFTIRLSDAAITSIDLQMPNTKYPDLLRLESFEQVAFTYRKIQWAWTEGGLVADDTTSDRV